MYFGYFLPFFMLLINLPFERWIVVILFVKIRSLTNGPKQTRIEYATKTKRRKKNMNALTAHTAKWSGVKWSEVSMCVCVCLQRLTNAISSIDEIKLKIYSDENE